MEPKHCKHIYGTQKSKFSVKIRQYKQEKDTCVLTFYIKARFQWNAKDICPDVGCTCHKVQCCTVILKSQAPYRNVTATDSVIVKLNCTNTTSCSFSFPRFLSLFHLFPSSPFSLQSLCNFLYHMFAKNSIFRMHGRINWH